MEKVCAEAIFLSTLIPTERTFHQMICEIKTGEKHSKTCHSHVKMPRNRFHDRIHRENEWYDDSGLIIRHK